MAVHPCNHSTPGAEAGNLPEFEVSMIYIASSRLVGGCIMRTHLKTKMKIILQKRNFVYLEPKCLQILNLTVLTLLSTLNVNNAPHKTTEQFHLQMEIH